MSVGSVYPNMGFPWNSRRPLEVAALSSPDDRPVVRILGTHGVPAAYGGFETAAENVACSCATTAGG